MLHFQIFLNVLRDGVRTELSCQRYSIYIQYTAVNCIISQGIITEYELNMHAIVLHV